MLDVVRSNNNPILLPREDHVWEAAAAFNGCVVAAGDTIHMVYRALSHDQTLEDGTKLRVSTIGYANSRDGVRFTNRRQLMKPRHEWERYGCEDPRIAYVEGKYVIFYTALSTYPFTPAGIKVAAVITDDLRTTEDRTLLTPFNAKAMSLFPKKINGKWTAIVSADTDRHPVKIAVASSSSLEELLSYDFWQSWYGAIDKHTLHLRHAPGDHVEIGAPPVYTERGWLLLYSHIYQYFSASKIFCVNAVLLDHDDPTRVISRLPYPFIAPTTPYELEGDIANIVFPTGAMINDNMLSLYYGAADTSVCLAQTSLTDVLDRMQPIQTDSSDSRSCSIHVNRSIHNPLITPDRSHNWESAATFNPTALRIEENTHVLYRAIGKYKTSVMGYAQINNDGQIQTRHTEPVYEPRAKFEQKQAPSFSGCEDPRLIRIKNTIHLTYNAFTGLGVPRVAHTTIALDDFMSHTWKWSTPVMISPPHIECKHACMMTDAGSETVFVYYCRQGVIWIDKLPLPITADSLLGGVPMLFPQTDWEGAYIAPAAPPISADNGYILFYNAVLSDGSARAGAAFLDQDDPAIVLSRLQEPLLEPAESYETTGRVPNKVFVTDAVHIGQRISIYYGAADTVVASASFRLDDLFRSFPIALPDR